MSGVCLLLVEREGGGGRKNLNFINEILVSYVTFNVYFSQQKIKRKKIKKVFSDEFKMNVFQQSDVAVVSEKAMKTNKLK